VNLGSPAQGGRRRLGRVRRQRSVRRLTEARERSRRFGLVRAAPNANHYSRGPIWVRRVFTNQWPTRGLDALADAHDLVASNTARLGRHGYESACPPNLGPLLLGAIAAVPPPLTLTFKCCSSRQSAASISATTNNRCLHPRREAVADDRLVARRKPGGPIRTSSCPRRAYVLECGRTAQAPADLEAPRGSSRSAADDVSQGWGPRFPSAGGRAPFTVDVRSPDSRATDLRDDRRTLRRHGAWGIAELPGPILHEQAPHRLVRILPTWTLGDVNGSSSWFASDPPPLPRPVRAVNRTRIMATVPDQAPEGCQGRCESTRASAGRSSGFGRGSTIGRYSDPARSRAAKLRWGPAAAAMRCASAPHDVEAGAPRAARRVDLVGSRASRTA